MTDDEKTEHWLEVLARRVEEGALDDIDALETDEEKLAALMTLHDELPPLQREDFGVHADRIPERFLPPEDDPES